MATIPSWAKKFKTKGTEIRCINGKYYLYAITSKRVKEKSYPVKVSLGMIGRITPEGIIYSKKELLKRIKVREYGLSWWIYNCNKDICDNIKKHFKWFWEEILAGVYNIIGYRSPIKRYEFYYENSYLKEIIGGNINRNSFSKNLEKLGVQRGEISRYMKRFIKEEDMYALIDMTSIMNQSKQMEINHVGYNSHHTYKPQINLVFIYNESSKEPVYYHMEPGNKRDVLSLKRVVDESGLRNSIVICDKGFKSIENIEYLEKVKLKYIFALKRNDPLIDYSSLSEKESTKSLKYFFYKKRPIWYYEKYLENGRRLIVYIDEILKSSEIQDYLWRIEEGKEGYTEENFYEKRNSMGTIAILTNEKKLTAERVYELYKLRCDIEQMYDVYHGYFQIDKSYLRNQYQLEGWLFINFVALTLYYRLYKKLIEKDLLKTYSVEDIIEFLKETKVYHNTKTWQVENIQKKYLKIFEKLEICIA